MKKNLLTMFISLIVGFFLSNLLLNQYGEYKGLTVYNEGEMFYFIEYGEYSSYEEMEKNTINLENYIYQEENSKYYVYIGITKKEEVANKMENYFKSLNYNPNLRQFYITNKDFILAIDNYDQILKSTDDNTVISEIINQGLTTYEEVVIGESKN